MQATDDSQVNSWIGPPTGSTTGGTPASVNASGNVTVSSLLDSTATSESKLGSVSLGGALGIIKAIATNTADVRSYLGDAATTTATGNTVSFSATLHARVKADGFGIAAAGGFAGTGVLVTADMKPSVKTFTESGGSITAHTINFTSNVNDNLGGGDTCADFAACADGTGGAAALGAVFNDTDGNATDSPTVRTGIGSGTQLTASTGGSVNVLSNVKQKAKAEVLTVAIAAGFAGGASNARAVASGSTASYVDGTILQAGSVTVRASDDFTVRSYSENISGALLASAAFSLSKVTIGDAAPSDPPTVAAYVGGNITATNNVTVASAATTSALAEAQLDLRRAGRDRPQRGRRRHDPAHHPHIRERVARWSPASPATSPSSPPTTSTSPAGPYIAGKSTDATAGSYGGGLVSLDIGSDIDAISSADVDATIKGGATARAGNTVNVIARSSNVASARFESVNIGGVAISAGAKPTATASGKTAARLIGNVLAGDNVVGGCRVGDRARRRARLRERPHPVDTGRRRLRRRLGVRVALEPGRHRGARHDRVQGAHVERHQRQGDVGLRLRRDVVARCRSVPSRSRRWTRRRTPIPRRR